MKTFIAKIWRALSFPKSIQLAIMRMFQDQFLIGVTGIIFNDQDEVLLFKHTYRQPRWSLPGGYMKGKEHPAEGLEREIEEESGFTVSVDEQLKIRTDRGASRLDICLIGVFIGGEFRKSAEVTEAKFFSFEDLPNIRRSQLLFIQEALNLHKGKA